MNDLELRTRLTADASGLNAALRQGEKGVQEFADGAAEAAKESADVTTRMVDALRDGLDSIAPGISRVTRLLPSMSLSFTAAGVAVGGLGAAYYKGSQEADAFRRAVLLSGNAAGTSVGELQAHARAVDDLVGTQAEAAAVLAKLAESGDVANGSLTRVAETIVRMERDLGVSADKAVAMFTSLGREPVKAVAKLNEQYNFLTVAVYEQIKALQASGREADATALAQDTLAEAMANRARQAELNLGSLEKMWRTLRDSAKEAWDAMLNVGRPKSAQSELADLEASIKVQEEIISRQKPGSRIRGFNERELEGDRQRAESLRLQIQLEQDLAAGVAASTAAVKQHVQEDQKRQRVARERKKELTDEQKDAIALQKQYEAVASEAARRAVAEQQAATKASVAETAQMAASNEAMRLEIETMGLTGQALLAVEQARISSAIATREAALAEMEASGAYSQQTEELRKQIDALREKGRLLATRTGRQEILDAEAQWKRQREQEEDADRRRAEGIQKSIEDGLLEGFREGRSISEAFRRELEAQFKATVLRPLIAPVAQQGADLLTMLINGISGIVGGGITVDTSGAGTPAPPVPGLPRGGMATGTNRVPRDMLALVHQGEAIVPAKYNPHAGGMAGSRPQIVYAPVTNVDARADRADVLRMVEIRNRQGHAEFLEMMDRREL